VPEPLDPPPFPDGRYPVIIVDAVGADAAVETPGAEESIDSADVQAATAVIRIEVMVTAGPSKGQVVALNANLPEIGDSVDPTGLATNLLGLPGDLIVTEGNPRFELDAV
jgi:hypothetical protein